jgi:diguanylate cyclase (GGDEF)-like protein
MSTDLTSALSSILNSVVSPDDLDSLLDKACSKLCSVNGFDRVGVALYDPEQNAFVERVVCQCAAGGVHASSTEKRHIPRSEENLLGQAVIHSLPYAYATSETPPRSEVVIPLLSRENLIGTLSVESNEKKFDEGDLERLADYGRILSVAIENRLLSSGGHDIRNRDALTGLYSQRYLQARITHEIDRVDRFGGVFSLAIVELDDFNQFRKDFGYSAASQALKDISKKLSENLRDVDVAARYGEKEFAMLLPHADLGHALLAVKRIQKLVREAPLPSSDSREVRPTMSIGIAVYPMDSPFKDGLLEAADMALARAREMGSGQICTYAELAEEQGILSGE